jgi:hypothetical protein
LTSLCVWLAGCGGLGKSTAEAGADHPPAVDVLAADDVPVAPADGPAPDAPRDAPPRDAGRDLTTDTAVVLDAPLPGDGPDAAPPPADTEPDAGAPPTDADDPDDAGQVDGAAADDASAG